MKYLIAAFLLFISFPSGSLAGKKSQPMEVQFTTDVKDGTLHVYFMVIPKLKPEEEVVLGEKMARAGTADKVFFTKLGENTNLVIFCKDPAKVDVAAALAVLGAKFKWKFVKKPD